MPRKASIHFKPVTNVRFAVSHSERTDLSEPGYLLPKEHQLANIVVTGSRSEQELAALFIQQQEGMTGQAKARGSSPFWEGVVVLPNTDGKEQEENLQAWAKAYEQSTGHKVLHMSIHLDEGYIDKAGAVHYNPHAHVIVSRMDERNRVISLDRKQLAKVQDLTAETLKMQRGSTLEERQGKRGRKHIEHREFRLLENAKRLELTQAKKDAAKAPNQEVKELKSENKYLTGLLRNGAEPAPKETPQERTARVAEIELQRFITARGFNPEASPEDVRQAKTLELIEARSQAGRALIDAWISQPRQEPVKAPDVPSSSEEKAAELAKLKADYAQERQAMKDSGAATQRDYQELKKAHELALSALKESQTKVEKMEKEIQTKDGQLAEARAKFAAMANAYQLEKATGTPAHLIVPSTGPAAPQDMSEDLVAKRNIASNIEALRRQPCHQERSFEDLTKMAYWRGVVAEKNKSQPHEVMVATLARFDEKISGHQVELPDIPKDVAQKNQGNEGWER